MIRLTSGAAVMDGELKSLWKNGVHAFGEGDARAFVALYADDLLMMWKSRKVLDHVKIKLQENLTKHVRLQVLGMRKELMGMFSG